MSLAAELAVDRQAQHVTVEVPASAQIDGVQQDPAAQYIHATILIAGVKSTPLFWCGGCQVMVLGGFQAGSLGRSTELGGGGKPPPRNLST